MSFKNLNAFKKRLKNRLDTKAHANAFSAVRDSALVVEKFAQESIKKSGTGKTYELYNPRRTHTASEGGKPPATDQGNLGNGISINIDSKKSGAVVGQIISSAPYSKALEFGTINMTERPFMRPALRKNKNKIISIFKREGIIR